MPDSTRKSPKRKPSRTQDQRRKKHGEYHSGRKPSPRLRRQKPSGLSPRTKPTHIVDSQVYTKQHLAEVYGLRWAIETGVDHLKTTMNMNVLHCQTVAGVMKELTM